MFSSKLVTSNQVKASLINPYSLLAKRTHFSQRRAEKKGEGENKGERGGRIYGWPY